MTVISERSSFESYLPVIWVGLDLDQPQSIPFPHGRLFGYTIVSPLKTRGKSEDAAVVAVLDKSSGLLAVADGVGGSPEGAKAARELVHRIAKGQEPTPSERIETQTLLTHSQLVDGGIGNCTTMVAAALDGSVVRILHVGDSEALVVRQDSSVIHRTVGHSPVRRMEAERKLNAQEAMFHPSRHLVDRVVGGPYELKVEKSPAIPIESGDTILLASDGLFDNFLAEEIVERMIDSSPEEAASRLMADARTRMGSPVSGRPSKPDDLTFFLLRVG